MFVFAFFFVEAQYLLQEKGYPNEDGFFFELHLGN
jgi:hypothetical protein